MVDIKNSWIVTIDGVDTLIKQYDIVRFNNRDTGRILRYNNDTCRFEIDKSTQFNSYIDSVYFIDIKSIHVLKEGE